MPVQYGSHPDGDVRLDTGTLVHQLEDGTWLVSDTSLDRDEVPLSEIDDQPGRVRLYQPPEHDDDELTYTEMTFDTLRMARLAYGLWDQCGPFVQPEGDAVPIEVATAGQDAIAAYLRLGNGYLMSRSYVAERMDVTEQTVSNYCNRIRWRPE